MTLSPNALMPCPSESAKRRHWAHGRICPECEPDAEWTARCPLCLDSVPAKGREVLPHDVEGRGRRMAGFACPGTGAVVEPPAVGPSGALILAGAA